MIEPALKELKQWTIPTRLSAARLLHTLLVRYLLSTCVWNQVWTDSILLLSLFFMWMSRSWQRKLQRMTSISSFQPFAGLWTPVLVFSYVIQLVTADCWVCRRIVRNNNLWLSQQACKYQLIAISSCSGSASRFCNINMTCYVVGLCSAVGDDDVKVAKRIVATVHIVGFHVSPEKWLHMLLKPLGCKSTSSAQVADFTSVIVA